MKSQLNNSFHYHETVLKITMDIERSYLGEEERLHLIRDYLKHEQKKSHGKADESLSCIEQKTTRRHAELTVQFLENKNSKITSIPDYWFVFHGLSYGLLDKALWNCVGVPNIRWAKHSFCGHAEYCIESPQGWLKEESVRWNNRLPISEARQLIKTKSQDSSDILRNSIDEYCGRSKEQRAYDPMLGTLENNCVVINDGNGRLQMWLEMEALGQNVEWSEVEIWVGIPGRDQTSDDSEAFELAKKDLFVVKNKTAI